MYVLYMLYFIMYTNTLHDIHLHFCASYITLDGKVYTSGKDALLKAGYSYEML